jgi:hypothetical protein
MLLYKIEMNMNYREYIGYITELCLNKVIIQLLLISFLFFLINYIYAVLNITGNYNSMIIMNSDEYKKGKWCKK